MWWIMIGTVAAVHARVRRRVAPRWPGVGASSRRRKSRRGKGEGSPRGPGPVPLMRSAPILRASTLLTDGHDGRGAQPERFVGILDLEAHGEASSQTHPVDRLLDARQPHGARAVLGEHRPPETDHRPSEALARHRLEMNVGW